LYLLERKILEWWTLPSAKKGDYEDVLKFIDDFQQKFLRLKRFVENHLHGVHFVDEKRYRSEDKPVFIYLSEFEWNKYFATVQDGESDKEKLIKILRNLTTFVHSARFDESSRYYEDTNLNRIFLVTDLTGKLNSRLVRAVSPEDYEYKDQTKDVFQSYKEITNLILSRLEALKNQL
jgi:hypothetical protein